MEQFYLWVKALHVIAVIAWMAAMLYLPRLFVYHARQLPGSAQDQLLQLMERRLLLAIMTPAMIFSLIFGLGLIHIVGWDGIKSWFIYKAFLLFLLFALHGYFSSIAAKFKRGVNTKTAVFYKIVNEMVTVIMIAIVILAVVKPF